MITAAFIHRTFRIAHGERTGSAFALDIDGKHYLVTAKHVIESFGSSGTLDVFSKGAWRPVAATLVAHGGGDVDVSVLAPSVVLCPPGLPVTADSNGLVYGQDLYFLGFPYGILSKVVFTDAAYPLPLVKKGILSAFAGDVYLLDGHGNPGFSGGPVIFNPEGRGAPTNIAAVVTDINTWDEPVFEEDEETGLTYQENTGIVVSCKIEVVLAMIRANPIGIGSP
jgi:S1-C subfamily serine protease